MLISENKLNLQGEFFAELHDPKTGLVSMRKRSKNIITRAGKNLIVRFLLDSIGFSTGLTYQAVGTGTTTPTANDMTLETEEARQSISIRRDTAGTVAAFFTFFPASVIPDTIEEVGIFGHSTATDTADSGILFARTLLNIVNSANEDLTLTYVLTIG